MSLAYEQQASSGLQQLGLDVAEKQLDQAAQQAAAAGWSYTHFLGYLLDAELRFRHEKTVRLNLQFANLPYQKRLDSFDFQQQPSIDKRLIEELATGRFLHEGRNVVLLGPPGVGKTHLALALGVLTAEMGHRIYFTTAIELARRMARAMADNRLSREIKNLTRPKLLIIDEVGYLTLEAAHASLLFQAICERYEKQQSIVLTSNEEAVHPLPYPMQIKLIRAWQPGDVPISIDFINCSGCRGWWQASPGFVGTFAAAGVLAGQADMLLMLPHRTSQEQYK